MGHLTATLKQAPPHILLSLRFSHVRAFWRNFVPSRNMFSWGFLRGIFRDGGRRVIRVRYPACSRRIIL